MSKKLLQYYRSKMDVGGKVLPKYQTLGQVYTNPEMDSVINYMRSQSPSIKKQEPELTKEQIAKIMERSNVKPKPILASNTREAFLLNRENNRKAQEEQRKKIEKEQNIKILVDKGGYSERDAKQALFNKDLKALNIIESVNNENYRIQMHPDFDPKKSTDEQRELLNDNSLRARLLRGSNMMMNTGNPALNFVSGMITAPGRSFANLTTDADKRYFNSQNSVLGNVANFAEDVVNVYPSIIPKTASALSKVPNVVGQGFKTANRFISQNNPFRRNPFNNYEIVDPETGISRFVKPESKPTISSNIDETIYGRDDQGLFSEVAGNRTYYLDPSPSEITLGNSTPRPLTSITQEDYTRLFDRIPRGDIQAISSEFTNLQGANQLWDKLRSLGYDVSVADDVQRNLQRSLALNINTRTSYDDLVRDLSRTYLQPTYNTLNTGNWGVVNNRGALGKISSFLGNKLNTLDQNLGKLFYRGNQAPAYDINELVKSINENLAKGVGVKKTNLPLEVALAPSSSGTPYTGRGVQLFGNPSSVGENTSLSLQTLVQGKPVGSINFQRNMIPFENPKTFSQILFGNRTNDPVKAWENTIGFKKTGDFPFNNYSGTGSNIITDASGKEFKGAADFMKLGISGEYNKAINEAFKSKGLGNILSGGTGHSDMGATRWENLVNKGLAHKFGESGFAGGYYMLKKQGGPIEDPLGQWAHPGQVTRIPSSRITMQGVSYPVYGVGSNGKKQIMYPNQEYDFGDAKYVDEFPVMQVGGNTTSYVDNPNDKNLKAYNDSLRLYNTEAAFLKQFKDSYTPSQREAFYKSQYINYGIADIGKKNRIEPIKTYWSKKNAPDGNPDLIAQYKKPVRRVEYRKPQPVVSIIQKPVPQPQVIDTIPPSYKMKGKTPVYGPNQSLIGMYDDDSKEFYPDYDNTAARANVNQQDSDLIKNMQMLQNYLRSKGVDPKIIDKNEEGGLINNSYKLGLDLLEYDEQLKNGGSLDRTVTCASCGWSWKFSDGGKDPVTCHQCGGQIKMKNGGSLPEYQTKGQVNTLYVDNPKDPRLKAYQDSLSLYNQTLANLKAFKKDLGWQYDDATLRSSIRKYWPNEISHMKASSKATEWYASDEENNDPTGTRESAYSTSGYKNKVIPTILPVDYYAPQWSDNAFSRIPRYKKPVRRVEYRKSEPIVPVVQQSVSKPQVVTPIPQPPLRQYTGTPVYSPGAGSGMGSALIGFRSDKGDITYIQPEDYQRFAVPKYAQDYLKSLDKKEYGGPLPKYQYTGLFGRPIDYSQQYYRNAVDNTKAVIPQADRRTFEERKKDELAALAQKAIANQPVTQSSRTVTNTALEQERLRRLKMATPESSGYIYNENTGEVEKAIDLSPTAARTLNRAMENIVEPMVAIEMGMSAAPLIGKGLKGVGELVTKRGYQKVSKPVTGTLPPPKQSGFPNVLAIADEIIPMPLAPQNLLGMPGGWMEFSPLNLIPGYGGKLSAKTAYPNIVGFRKFGNSLEDVIQRQALSPKGGSPLRIGKDQIVSEGNWAAVGAPDENYKGVFEATMNPQIEGSNIQLQRWPKRYGVVGTTKEGNIDIPLSDPGLSFNRRLPFSTRYVPIDKQKLMNNQFQLATMAPRLQSLAEKYGVGLGLAVLFGKTDLYNKYTIDPLIEQFEKLKNSELYKKQEGSKKKKEQGGWLGKYDEIPQAQEGEEIDKKELFKIIPIDVRKAVADETKAVIPKKDLRTKEEVRKEEIDKLAKKIIANQPVIKAGPGPLEQVSRDRANAEREREQIIQNSPLAQSFSSLSPSGYNPGLGRIGSETFVNANPLLTGPIMSGTRLIGQMKGNNPYGFNQQNVLSGQNALASLGLLGDLGMIRGATSQVPISRYVNKAGDYLVNNTPLRNTYKINPNLENPLGFRNVGDKPHWWKGYTKEVTPETIDLQAGFPEYIKQYSKIDDDLFKLRSSKKTNKEKQLFDRDQFYKLRQELESKLLSKTPLGKTLGSGAYGTVYEFKGYPQKAIKVGSNYGMKQWNQKLIDDLAPFREQGNIAIPSRVGYFDVPMVGTPTKRFLTKEVSLMDNLNKNDFNKLNLSGRDAYALLLKQARQLRDKGIFLDSNTENFNFNRNKGVWDIYDINPWSAAPPDYPHYYMSDLRHSLYNKAKTWTDLNKRKYGGPLPKYQTKGEVLPTIYVESLKDPRLKSYTDSLNLYKAMQMQDKLMGPNYNNDNTQKNRAAPLSSFSIKELKEARKKKIDPKLKYLGPISRDFQNEKDMFSDPYFVSSNDKKLIKYYKSLGFTDDNIMYHTSADLVHPNIKPIGVYHDGSAWSPIYKKPVQPIEYRKEEIPEYTNRNSEPIPEIYIPRKPIKNIDIPNITPNIIPNIKPINFNVSIEDPISIPKEEKVRHRRRDDRPQYSFYERYLAPIGDFIKSCLPNKNGSYDCPIWQDGGSLPIYQSEGEVSENTLNAMNAGKEYLQNWYQGRMQLPQFKNIAERRYNVLSKKKPGIVTNDKSLIKDNALAAYSKGVNKFFIPGTETPGSVSPFVWGHEYNHLARYFAPQILSNKFKKTYTRSFMKPEEMIDKYDIDPSSYKYLRDPRETESFLTMFRQHANLDPTKQYTKEEMYEKMKPYINSPSYKNIEELNKQPMDKQIEHGVQRFLQMFDNDPEKVLYLHNGIVGTNNRGMVPIAKSGGQHGGLDRWFAEKWVDVKTGKTCGRQEGESRAGYPACRPSRRVSSKTPKTSSEMSSAEKAKFKQSKTSSQRIPYNHKRK